MVSAFVHTLTICRPTPAALPQTSKQLNVACHRVLQTSTRGYRQIDWSWTRIRPNLSGSARVINSRRYVVATPLQVKDQLLQPTDTVHDLGILIDSQLTMEGHVWNVVRSWFYQLRQLRSIRRSLPTDARRTLAATFIASRVDYCNGVLYGISSQVIRQLQMVLNAAARLVIGFGRHKHITPALCEVLYWLSVPQQIQFKIAISAFDCVREHCPAYFNNVCIPVAGVSGRAHLRSAECHDMLVPSTRTQPGRPSFHVASPAVWNSLTSHLRSPSISHGQFRAGLKNHLFTQAYGHLWELLLKSVFFYIYI